MKNYSKYSDIAEKLVKSISNVSELKMRASLFFSKLCLLSDEGFIEVLNVIISRANAERGLNSDIIEVFFDQEYINEIIGKQRINDLINFAKEKGYTGVVDLLSKKSSTNLLQDLSREAIYDFDDRTIGERKSYAITNDPDLISKLLNDPEPMVIGKLLQNPRITEKEVLKIITRRPIKPDIIRVVAASIKWNSSYTIKDAIARNPYTPRDITLKILPTLMKQDLEEISMDGALVSPIRDRAKALLNEKRGHTDDYYIIDSIETNESDNN